MPEMMLRNEEEKMAKRVRFMPEREDTEEDKAFQDVFLERNVFSIDKQICAKNEVVNACNSIFLNATFCVEVVEKKIE